MNTSALSRRSRARFGCGRQAALWTLELWVRLEPDGELTDYRAIDELLEELRVQAPDLDIEIWTAPRLHAKVVWTEQGAMIGSANLTGAGFGDNLELAVRLEPHECVGAASIRDVLRQSATRVAREHWRAFVTKTRERPHQEGTVSGPVKDSPEAANWADTLEKLLSRRPEQGGIR